MPIPITADLLAILRSKGGRVSVHNDYLAEADGCLYTYWQMTFPLGPKDLHGQPTLIALVGKGEEDEVALEQIANQYNGIIAQQYMSGALGVPPPFTGEQLQAQINSVLASLGIPPLEECPHCKAGIPLEGEYHHDTSARGRGWEPADDYKPCENEHPEPQPGGIKDPGPGWV